MNRTEFTRALSRSITALLIGAVLAACGGGGGGGGGGTPPGVGFASVPASGVDPGSCVRDNVTGLIWEVKTADGGLRDWTKTYTNYDSTTSAQKWNGIALVAPSQAEIDAATNSVGFKNSVNAQGLCGFNDWRLPTVNELHSILDKSVTPNSGAPTINATWFPNTQAGLFWSASPGVRAGEAWVVDFLNGTGVGNGGGSRFLDLSFHVRLVRAGQ